jgi:hypothetical protein
VSRPFGERLLIGTGEVQETLQSPDSEFSRLPLQLQAELRLFRPSECYVASPGAVGAESQLGRRNWEFAHTVGASSRRKLLWP